MLCCVDCCRACWLLFWLRVLHGVQAVCVWCLSRGRCLNAAPSCVRPHPWCRAERCLRPHGACRRRMSLRVRATQLYVCVCVCLSVCVGFLLLRCCGASSERAASVGGRRPRARPRAPSMEVSEVLAFSCGSWTDCSRRRADHPSVRPVVHQPPISTATTDGKSVTASSTRDDTPLGAVRVTATAGSSSDPDPCWAACSAVALYSTKSHSTCRLLEPSVASNAAAAAASSSSSSRSTRFSTRALRSSSTSPSSTTLSPRTM